MKAQNSSSQQKLDMKTKLLAILALACLSTLNLLLAAAPMGTAFTYQGVATDNGRPATGLYDVQCALYDSPTDGVQVGPTLNLPGSTTDSNGVFTVLLDFGPGVFTGQARWLEFSLRTNGSSGAYTTLAPRQQLTPAPAAIWATTAWRATTAQNLAGVLSSAQLAGTYSGVVTFNNGGNSFTGNGYGLNNVNATTLGGLWPENFWQLGGNAATIPGVSFLGTTDNQPLEFKVNNIRGLRIEPNLSGRPNVIGGAPGNEVFNGAAGVTIGGGVINTVGAGGATIAGGYNNTIRPSASSSTIGGGENHIVGTNALCATVAGGESNTIDSRASYGTISGGFGDIVLANARYGAVGGGYVNLVSGSYGTIPGGFRNSATTNCFAAGYRAKANHTGSFVWADSQAADFTTTGANQFLIRAAGGVGINTAPAPGATLDVAGWVKASGLSAAGSITAHDITCSQSIFFPSTIASAVQIHKYEDSMHTPWLEFYMGAADSCSIDMTGVFYCRDVQEYSDAALKQDIAPLRNALDSVCQLRGVTFEWSRQGHPDELVRAGRQIGFIAQEVEQVLPELVGQDQKGIRAVSYSHMVPVLVEAIKEQRQRTEQIAVEKETEIQALKQELAELKAVVSRLVAQQKQGGL